MGLFGKIGKAIGGVFKGIGKAIAGVGKAVFKGIKAVFDFTIVKPLKFIGGIAKAILGNPILASILGTVGGGILGFMLGGPIGAFFGAQLGQSLLGGISTYMYMQQQQKMLQSYLQANMAYLQQSYATFAQISAAGYQNFYSAAQIAYA